MMLVMRTKSKSVVEKEVVHAVLRDHSRTGVLTWAATAQGQEIRLQAVTHANRATLPTCFRLITFGPAVGWFREQGVYS